MNQTTTNRLEFGHLLGSIAEQAQHSHDTTIGDLLCRLQHLNKWPRCKIQGLIQTARGQIRFVLGQAGCQHFTKKSLAKRVRTPEGQEGYLTPPTVLSPAYQGLGQTLAHGMVRSQILLKTKVQKAAASLTGPGQDSGLVAHAFQETPAVASQAEFG